MTPFFYLLFRDKYKMFMEFKSKASKLTASEIVNYYKVLEPYHIKRETDLNKKSIKFILNNIIGSDVLDISCGRGFLAKKIAEDKEIQVTGVDFLVSDNLKKSVSPKFIEASIEAIPFKDNKFDTVICTHTLEHIIDMDIAIKELRRVAKRRLIIVVPKQRDYKYTFDLHVQFFPYEHSLLKAMSYRGNIICLQNDWVYSENLVKE